MTTPTAANLDRWRRVERGTPKKTTPCNGLTLFGRPLASGRMRGRTALVFVVAIVGVGLWLALAFMDVWQQNLGVLLLLSSGTALASLALSRRQHRREQLRRQRIRLVATLARVRDAREIGR